MDLFKTWCCGAWRAWPRSNLEVQSEHLGQSRYKSWGKSLKGKSALVLKTISVGLTITDGYVGYPHKPWLELQGVTCEDRESEQEKSDIFACNLSTQGPGLNEVKRSPVWASAQGVWKCHKLFHCAPEPGCANRVREFSGLHIWWGTVLANSKIKNLEFSPNCQTILCFWRDWYFPRNLKLLKYASRAIQFE